MAAVLAASGRFVFRSITLFMFFGFLAIPAFDRRGRERLFSAGLEAQAAARADGGDETGTLK